MKISHLNTKIDEEITIKGWLYNKRHSGGLLFLQLRDGSGFVQGVVVKDEIEEKLFEKALRLTIESSVEVTGIVTKEERSPSGLELKVTSVTEISTAMEYPIGKKDHGIDFLLENRHLWLRSPSQWAIQRVRNRIILSIYKFFEEREYIKIDSPIFTPNSCEGTTTLFEVKYTDDSTVYLSQSGQLYLEAALFSFGKVFDFGPTFRAEKSKTRRHLTEFWMMDAETAFMNHQENMVLQEELILHIIKDVLENCREELSILERNTTVLEGISGPFPRVTYKEAIEKLSALGSDIKYGDDFGNDDETLITSEYKLPIFIEKFPASLKAFYMKRDRQDEQLVLGNDLLAPEGYGEIIGGSEREDNEEKLIERLEEHKLSKEDFSWYIDLRKYGSVPHSGFGLGLERLVTWICGLDHVRESIPFPRTIYRTNP